MVPLKIWKIDIAPSFESVVPTTKGCNVSVHFIVELVSPLKFKFGYKVMSTKNPKVGRESVNWRDGVVVRASASQPVDWVHSLSLVIPKDFKK